MKEDIESLRAQLASELSYHKRKSLENKIARLLKEKKEKKDNQIKLL